MFSEAILQAAIAHARAVWPAESCGAVIADTYVPFPNAATSPEVEFLINDPVFVNAQANGQVQAVIHSHPRVNATVVDAPSKADLAAQAAMAVPWGIIPVYGNDANGEPYFWGSGVPVVPLVGRAFRHGVHDCYSLIRDYYAITHSIQLSAYAYEDEWWNRGEDLYAQHFPNEGFGPVASLDDARPGDLFLAQIRSPVTNHAAVYLGDGLILHHLTGQLSCREPGERWLKFMTHHLRHSTLA